LCELDVERAANLGALAKPMRAALKTHKPIFWKKSAYGHSNESQQGRGLEAALVASESQWGSSGSTLDSLLFSSSRTSTPKVEEEKGSSSSLLASACSWEETQYEEREKTWDREGDSDFEMRAKGKIRRRK
jgi:hypothetical protein